MTHLIAITGPEQRPTPTAAFLAPPLRAPRTARSPRSLYIHIPFCTHKCHYCDFYSVVDRRDRQAAFTRRLRRELAAQAPLATSPLDTIFIGGGTPTLLHVDLWRELLDTLRREFDLSRIRSSDGEFTVECNPETASLELFDVLAASGVNRISMGAQSFEPRHLRTLERAHDPASVAHAARLARAAGIDRVSVDLIFAVPGQTLDEWRADLDRALDLGTSHLSCYALTYEPGTAMTARRDRAEFEPADPDLEADMYELTVRHLRAHGLDRYEVSNFARPGHECRHNLAYWRQDPWLACGPSASGHVDGHRWKNTPRLDTYLTTDEGGLAPIVEHEPPDPRRALAERLMTGVRLREGIDAPRALADATALGAGARLAACARRRIESAHLADSAGRWAPTDAGFLIADRIAAELMDALA